MPFLEYWECEEKMSLITLTFGYGNNRNNYSNSVHTNVRTPITNSKNKAGVLKVKKVCQFYNVNELYVIGEVIDGAVSESMKANINGNNLVVKEVESKYGAIGKKGVLVGTLIDGVQKEDIEVGQELHLEL